MEVPYLQPDLAPGVVQREWDQTLDRLRAIATITYVSTEVRPHANAFVSLRRVDEATLAEVERILMSNLLFALWLRVETEQEVSFSGEWLFRWRRMVPWRCTKVGGFSRLAPSTPQHQWTYRFNVVEAH
jgi:hypothetical protein